MQNIGGSNISNQIPGPGKAALPVNRRQGIFYGWLVLAAAFMTTTVGWGIYYSFAVFFKDLQSTFNANRAEISIAASIFIGTFFTMGVIYGWIIDKYSPRIMVGLGGLAVFVGMFISSRATVVWQLYVFLGFLSGAGVSATILPFIAVLSRWFVKRRGLVLGIQATGAGVGMMVFSPLSQRMLTAYGWRTSFDILGIIGLVVFSISAFLARGFPREKGLEAYGAVPSDTVKATAAKPSVTASNSEIDIPLNRAIKGRNLWMALGIRMALSLAIYMVNTHLVNFAKDAGMVATSAALLMTIVGLVSVGGKITAGHLADKIGSKRIVISCAVLMAAEMLWLSSPKGAVALQLSAVVYGLAYGGSFALMNTIVAEAFGVKFLGQILGVINLGSAVGSLFGPWLAGYVFDITGSYSIAFMIAAGVAVVAVICGLLFRERRP